MTVVLHHVESGPPDGPPLVMAGSLGSTLAMWEPQVEELSRRFRLIRLDHRGHGGSPVPPGPYRIADLAGDVLALLDDLGLDRVSWCGLSLGGMVGMALASEHPNRVDRLVLCCTSAHFPDATVWRDRIEAVAGGGTAPIAESVVSRWFTPGWAAANPVTVAESVAMVAGTADAGYLASCQAIEVWDHRERLPTISAATMVIAGSEDPATPVQPHAATLVESIPQARLEVLPAAHLATVERAADATRLIAAHCEE